LHNYSWSAREHERELREVSKHAFVRLSAECSADFAGLGVSHREFPRLCDIDLRRRRGCFLILSPRHLHLRGFADQRELDRAGRVVRGSAERREERAKRGGVEIATDNVDNFLYRCTGCRFAYAPNADAKAGAFFFSGSGGRRRARARTKEMEGTEKGGGDHDYNTGNRKRGHDSVT